MSEDEDFSPLSRREPGQATGHRPSSYAGPPRLSPADLQRIQAALRAAAAEAGESDEGQRSSPSAADASAPVYPLPSGSTAVPDPVTEPIPVIRPPEPGIAPSAKPAPPGKPASGKPAAPQPARGNPKLPARRRRAAAGGAAKAASTAKAPSATNTDIGTQAAKTPDVAAAAATENGAGTQVRRSGPRTAGPEAGAQPQAPLKPQVKPQSARPRPREEQRAAPAADSSRPAAPASAVQPIPGVPPHLVTSAATTAPYAPSGLKPGSPRRRHQRLTAVVGGVVILLAAGTVARALIHSSPVADGPASAKGSAWIGAAAWIKQQVAHDVPITCDKLMCKQLHWEGMPAHQLRLAAAGPRAAVSTPLIVVTPDLRQQFGVRLDSVIAPGRIAEFGTGSSAVEIRVTASSAATFWRLVSADVAARKADGSALLTSPSITASALARRQLTAGAVDNRLVSLVTSMATRQNVLVVAFGDAAPGADTAVSPLRSVELAEPAGIRAANAGYMNYFGGFARAQHGVYASKVWMVRQHGGRVAVRIRLYAPSLLGFGSSRQTVYG